MSETAQKRLKILFLITKSSWGGAQRYVFDLASHYSTKYDVLVGLGGNGPLKTALEARSVRTISLPFLQRDISLVKEVRTFFDLVKMIRLEKPDVVHLNSSKIGGLGALACRVAGVKKIIFTAHGWAFNEERPRLSRTAILFLHWVTVLLCTKTIAVSQKTADDISYLPLIAGRVEVIHNGLSPIVRYSKTEARRLLCERFPSLKTASERLHEVATERSRDKTIWIGTISELHPNKGLTHLLHTVAQLKNHVGIPHFVVVIIGEGGQRDALEAIIKNSGLERVALLLGNIPNAAEYLSALDIFTLTSTTEALPYVLLEAGDAHLPVIASKVGGISEIIDQLETGILVRSGNKKELSEAISILLADTAKRNALGKALQQKIAEDFSVQRMIEKTEKIYLS
ncbi:MAG: glycosyltransferase [Patescibacteria group bacterium]